MFRRALERLAAIRFPGITMRTVQKRAFTLVEMIAVMVIMGVLAATVTPALSTFTSIRNTALVNEIDRRLTLARAWAQSTGQPAGVTFDVTGQTLAMVRVQSSGAAPTALPASSADAPSSADRIASFAPGASLASATFTPSGYTTLWFDYAGVPHVRSSTGAYVGALTSDATIVTSGARTITLRRLTGVVEK